LDSMIFQGTIPSTFKDDHENFVFERH
jgi:hypothetical protein